MIGRHIPACAQIALGENRIHHRRRPERCDTGRLFIHDQRDLACRIHGSGLRRICDAARGHALDLCGVLPDRFTQRGFAPDGRRTGALGHHNSKAAPVQPHDHAGRQIARAAHQHPGLSVLLFHCCSP